MKPKDIIIATALILILGSFLSGCKLIESKEPSADKTIKQAETQQLVKKAAAAKKEVKIVLKAQKEGAKVSVKILLENPKQKPLISVQSWLSYDPAKLQGASINLEGSDFSLMAPYDNTFDKERGLVMLGRANPEPVTKTEVLVAEVVFDIAQNGTAMLDHYDYREDLTGHTSANAMIDNKPYNILIKPESPALIIEN